MKVKYWCDIDNLMAGSRCPFGGAFVDGQYTTGKAHVGSLACMECVHYKGFNRKKQFVNCTRKPKLREIGNDKTN